MDNYEKGVREFHIKNGFKLDACLAQENDSLATLTLESIASQLQTVCNQIKGPAMYFQPKGDERLYRIWLILEEAMEACEALAATDEIGLADALADLRYVNEGTAITYRIPLEEVFSAVQVSNMSKKKRDIATNQRMRDKGPAYTSPKIQMAIDVGRMKRGTACL